MLYVSLLNMDSNFNFCKCLTFTRVKLMDSKLLFRLTTFNLLLHLSIVHISIWRLFLTHEILGRDYNLRTSQSEAPGGFQGHIANFSTCRSCRIGSQLILEEM